MDNFDQQIKRIDYTIEEINKLNVITSYCFVSESLIKFQELLLKTIENLKKYTIEINDTQNPRGNIINEYFTEETKTLINLAISKLSLDLREISRKESSEAYILVSSLLKNSKPIPFIISASGEEGHGGTISFKEYITNVRISQITPLLNRKINDIETFEQYLDKEGNNIHLINYNAQDLKMNAFHWCLLYHEAFHIFDKEIMRIDDFKNIEKNIDLANDIYNKNEEIMVDILSTIYCGLPYPYSLLQLLEENPERGPEHLAPINRLLVVKKCLEQLKKEYKSKYQEKIDTYGEGVDDFEVIFLDSFDKVNNNIESVCKSLKKEVNEDEKEDINQSQYIENNFFILYQHAKEILKKKEIKSFIDQINTTDETVKITPLEIKQISEYCSLFVPPIVNPILLFNGLLNVFLQKNKYIQDKRIKNSWNKSDKEIAETMLDMLKMSLKKWWATREYYSAKEKISL